MNTMQYKICVVLHQLSSVRNPGFQNANGGSIKPPIESIAISVEDIKVTNLQYQQHVSAKFASTGRCKRAGLSGGTQKA